MEKRKNENENESLERGKYFRKNAERLETVTREEQNDAYDRATRLAAWRLRSRTHRSIHSEMALGVPAVPYYVGEAV
ncbi:MAG: hypothetical protein IJ692_02220 [Alloprevotella sp.]|nr:hypothetical protein [Alloprevotella sp.]